MNRFLVIFLASVAMVFSTGIASAKKAPKCRMALAKCTAVGMLTATGKAGFGACVAGLKKATKERCKDAIGKLTNRVKAVASGTKTCRKAIGKCMALGVFSGTGKLGVAACLGGLKKTVKSKCKKEISSLKRFSKKKKEARKAKKAEKKAARKGKKADKKAAREAKRKARKNKRKGGK